MSKDTRDPSLTPTTVGPSSSTVSRTSDWGALLISLLLFGSSFGLAAVEDDPVAAEAAVVEETGTPVPDDPLSLLEQVAVAPEADGSGYDRDEFKHWVDADRDGCDTRQEVLLDESQEPTQSSSERGCPVTGGQWLSMYDGVVVTNPSQLDIDHMVPLKEAWESTAAAWTAAQREAYANDLDEVEALIAVTASTNRSKSDRDPGEWRPPDESNWCTYATSWVTVKIKWSLNADEDEVSALEEMLATC